MSPSHESHPNDQPPLTVAVACDVKLAKYFTSTNDRVAQSYVDVSSEDMTAAILALRLQATGEILITATDGLHQGMSGHEGHHYFHRRAKLSPEVEADWLFSETPDAKIIRIDLPARSLQMLGDLDGSSDQTTESEVIHEVQSKLQEAALHTVHHAATALNVETMNAQQSYIKRQTLKLLGKTGLISTSVLAGSAAPAVFEQAPKILFLPLFMGGMLLARRLSHQFDRTIATSSPAEITAPLSLRYTSGYNLASVTLGMGDYYHDKRIVDEYFE